MSVQVYRFWGLVMLLASCSMPWSVRVVPEVRLQRDQNVVQNDRVIYCQGCNPLIFGRPLNINQASVQHLKSLPYIGDKRARDIVSHRAQFGDFESVDELDDVKGIGPKTLKRLRPYIITE